MIKRRNEGIYHNFTRCSHFRNCSSLYFGWSQLPAQPSKHCPSAITLRPSIRAHSTCQEGRWRLQKSNHIMHVSECPKHRPLLVDLHISKIRIKCLMLVVWKPRDKETAFQNPRSRNNSAIIITLRVPWHELFQNASLRRVQILSTAFKLMELIMIKKIKYMNTT